MSDGKMAQWMAADGNWGDPIGRLDGRYGKGCCFFENVGLGKLGIQGSDDRGTSTRGLVRGCMGFVPGCFCFFLRILDFSCGCGGFADGSRTAGFALGHGLWYNSFHRDGGLGPEKQAAGLGGCSGFLFGLIRRLIVGILSLPGGRAMGFAPRFFESRGLLRRWAAVLPVAYHCRWLPHCFYDVFDLAGALGAVSVLWMRGGRP